MKRIAFTVAAVVALTLPTLVSAQDVKTVYRPEVHGTVLVVPQSGLRPVTPVLTAAEVIARHRPMAASFRGNPRPDYPAAAHCERLIADARKAR